MPFIAKRVSRTYTQNWQARPAQAFPLLCPVREAEWADGWQAQVIYSLSGLAEDNCVFTTSSHDGDIVWVITKYDPMQYEVEFINVKVDECVGRIHIQLADTGDGSTEARISYTYTALSEAGNHFVDRFSEAHFHKVMVHWQQAINHYLTTGETLPSHHDSLEH